MVLNFLHDVCRFHLSSREDHWQCILPVLLDSQGRVSELASGEREVGREREGREGGREGGRERGGVGERERDRE